MPEPQSRKSLDLPSLTLLRSFVRLGRAAVLAGMLLTLGTSDATAGPFDVDFCFPDGEFSCIPGPHTFEPGEDVSHEFQFPLHTFKLTFEQVLDPFTLFVDAGVFEDESIPGFPTWQCVPYGPGGVCINYVVTPAAPSTDYPQQGVHYSGPFEALIAWLADTDGLWPEARIFHAPADEPGDYNLIRNQLYASDIDDPGVRGETDNFSVFIVGSQGVVPEPGVLLLMGAGIGAALLRRRRGHDRRA
jgi:hypothetical protein